LESEGSREAMLNKVLEKNSKIPPRPLFFLFHWYPKESIILEAFSAVHTYKILVNFKKLNPSRETVPSAEYGKQTKKLD
jgi:hypothetical protein